MAAKFNPPPGWPLPYRFEPPPGWEPDPPWPPPPPNSPVCLQNPAHNALFHGVTIEVTAVPCSTAHSAQIFTQFRATGGATFPGGRVLAREAGQHCRSTLAARVRRSKIGPKTFVGYLYPDSTSWFTGRRAISCLVIDPVRDLTTSVLKRRATG